MHCIVEPGKFDDVLFISLLRKKQIFTKKRGSKVYIFKKVPIFKNISSPAIWKNNRGAPWKKLYFSCISFFFLME
jgi:hypothetical protein